MRLFGHSQRTALTSPPAWRRLVSSRLSWRDWEGIEFTAAGRTKPGTGRGDPVIMLNPVLFALLEKYLAKTESWKSRRWKRQSKKRNRSQWILQPCAIGGLRSCRQPAGGEMLASDIPLVVIETSRTRVDERESAGSAQYWAMRRTKKLCNGASGMCKMADPDDSQRL